MSTSAELARLGASLAVLVLAGCAHAPRLEDRVDVSEGVDTSTLGRVAIATFGIEGRVRKPGNGVERRVHADTMAVTDTFIGGLRSASLDTLERTVVDDRLRDLGLDPETTHARGLPANQEFEAQTLVVGTYRFECSGALAETEGGDFVKPTRVHRQTLSVRGYAAESGRLLFDVELALAETEESERLLPRSLARAAARRLLAALERE